MINKSIKRLLSILPRNFQQYLRMYHYERQIVKGQFNAGEIEYEQLQNWIKPGDWVLDIGANIGHYTYRMSELVGDNGRVIAFEPIPETFRILSKNMRLAPFQNITLMNVAISDRTANVNMEIPMHDTNLTNYYMAKITSNKTSIKSNCNSVMSIPVDSLNLNEKISLIKIDVEGHEKQALDGMIELLRRDCPILIVEGNDKGVEELLTGLGYKYTENPGSPNRVFHN